MIELAVARLLTNVAIAMMACYSAVAILRQSQSRTAWGLCALLSSMAIYNLLTGLTFWFTTQNDSFAVLGIDANSLYALGNAIEGFGLMVFVHMLFGKNVEVLER